MEPSGRTAKVRQTLKQAHLHRFRVASAEQSRRGRLRMTTLYSHAEFTCAELSISGSQSVILNSFQHLSIFQDLSKETKMTIIIEN
jgi:hypothetical protein